MVDAMNHDNFKQPSAHDSKHSNTYDSKRKIHIVIIEAKYSNKN
jgi:hypothetical protein